tara:strand:- start:10873 stop:12303 length:1431 start_codon:yes stop_codon:yes gene_type:complete
MLRKFFLLFFFYSTLTFGQEKVAQFINSLKTSNSNIKDVVPIVNTKNGDFAIFIADAKNVYAYKLDSTYKVKEKMASNEKRRKFKEIVGSSISDDNENYRVFLSDKSNINFLSFNFSFKNGQTSSKEFQLKKGERFIQTFNSNNKFYLITTSFYTKGLYIYSFDDAGNPSKKQIDLNGIKLTNWKNKIVPISEFLTSSQSVKKIEESNPNSIEIVASDTKMYIRDHHILFTFDEAIDFTQVLNIDLTNYKTSSILFDKPMQDAKSVNTNSYLCGDNFFTLASNKDKLVMEVLDYKTGNIIKEYKILKDLPITFKNTPIIQKGGIYNGYRELEKTKKFLRKINSGQIGLSVLKRNNRYEITIGGYVLQSSGGGFGMSMGGFGMSFGGSGGGSVGMFYNPTMFAYGSYTSSKSTIIDCLFDENFNHVKGKIEDNAFDKMKEYDSPVKSAETVFKYKNFYLKGNYSSVTKGYSLRKFTN